jgi:hypothetical protein
MVEHNNVVCIMEHVQQKSLRKRLMPYKNKVLAMYPKERAEEKVKLLQAILKDHENPQLRAMMILFREVELG